MRQDILDDFQFEEDENPNEPFDIGLFLSEQESSDVVAKFYIAMEAEVAASKLRSEGIPCFLANVTSQSVMPHLQSIIRLHVRPIDLQQAKDILKEIQIDVDGENESKSPNWAQAILLVLACILGVFLARILFGT